MVKENYLGSSNQVYGEGNGNPLQYSCLETPMDGGAWWGAVHGVAKSWTWLSDFIFTFHFYTLDKEMATHSSVLVWRIPGIEEPGGLQSMGSHRVGHDWSDLAAAAIRCNWVRSDSEVCDKRNRHFKEPVPARLVADQVSRGRGSEYSFHYLAWCNGVVAPGVVTMSIPSDLAVTLPLEQFFWVTLAVYPSLL